jgi:hypothetical protein
VRSAFDSVVWELEVSKLVFFFPFLIVPMCTCREGWLAAESRTYTCTFFSCTEAVAASAGKSSTDTAASALTTSATVVKNPKTDCTRFKEECIVDGGREGRMKPAGPVCPYR